MSEPDFRKLFESAPCLSVVLSPNDPTYTIQAVSDAYVEAALTHREEILGRGLFEVLPDTPDRRQAMLIPNLQTSLRKVLATKTVDAMPVQKYDIRRSHRNGGQFEERWWRPVNVPFIGDDGEIAFIIHRVEDVTEFVGLTRVEADRGSANAELRARTDSLERELAESQRLMSERRAVEEHLRASEARFSLAFAEAAVGMALTTPDGRITEVNQAYLNMLGYSREEVETHDSSSFTHPDDIDATRRFFASLAEGPASTGVFEKRYLRKSGEIFWARASATMRRDEHGKPAQVIAIIEDVTERKQAEERLRAIYDGTYEYLGLLAPDGTVLEANRASLEFGGSTREDIVGRLFWEMPWFAPTPGAPEVARQGVSRAAAGEFVRYEATLRRPSGELTIFDISLHPIRDERGEVALIVPEGRNITERKVLELRNAFLVRLDDATRPLTNPRDITQTAARLLGEYLQVNRCAYADVEADEDTFNLTGDYNDGVSSIVGRYTFTQFGDECLRLMREGKPYVVVDSETDPRVATRIDSYRLTCIRSVICVPLMKLGRLVGAMAVHQITPREWIQDEVKLVQLVASRCWESIERAHVERELRESERRLRLSQRAGRIGSFEWRVKEDVLIWTSELEALYGLPEGSFEGSFGDWTKRVVNEDAERITAELRNAFARRQTEHGYEFRAVLPDGTFRWLRGQAQFSYDEDGTVERMVGINIDINDQKLAEAELHRQWKTFDTALSNTPDFTYIFDLEGRFRYVNRSLLSLWQISLTDAVGRNFFDLRYPPELAARLQQQIRTVIETREPLRDQTPFTGPTGETRYYDYIFVPVFAANGEVEAVAGSTRDNTDQKQADNIVREDRRRWRDLLLQAPASIAVLRGPEHRFEWINENYRRLVSRPTEAIIGKAVIEALPEVETQIYLLDNVYKTGNAYFGHESLVRLGQGEGQLREVYLNFVYMPTRDHAGEIDGIFLHATDVTDMVLARKQVEESERQFRTLAETIPHLAWMADDTGYIFWYNRRWYDYTGTTLAEMEGWGWKAVHDPTVLTTVMTEWQTALTTGQPFEMVFPLKGADGLFRPFLTRVEPVRDSAGRVVRWFGTNTDITEQQRTEEQLRRVNRELEEFAYVASHDLKEPLRMVNIYTHLILRSIPDPDEKLRQYVSFVQQGVSRMEALIHDLLAFSRTVHTEEPAIGTADLSIAFSEALSVLKNRIEEAGAVITVEPLPLTRGETAQIALVFQNLLSNALKYRNKKKTPAIRVRAELKSDNWVVSIADNGIGFESKYAERIFGLFKRLHKDDYPGTGLGLAICKRIIERYGGRMWAEGKPDKGAVFCFSLPRPDLP